MPKFRKVDVRVHGDRKYRALSRLQPSGQALWLYLLTCEVEVPGVILTGRHQLAEILGWPIDALTGAFAELEVQGMASADWDARLVYLPNGLRYDAPANPNVVKWIVSAWVSLPDCELKNRFLNRFREHCAERGAAFVAVLESALGREASAGRAEVAELFEPTRSSNGTANGLQNGSGNRIGKPQPQPQPQQQPKRDTCGEQARLVGDDESELASWLREHYPDIRDPHALATAAEAAFDRIDLLAEAKAALAWEEANPRKGKSDHARFLNGWWSRSNKAAPPRRKPRLPDQWWTLLTRDEHRAFLAERAELHPALTADAPMSVEGAVDGDGSFQRLPALVKLLARYRGLAASRLTATAGPGRVAVS